ncbi:MAG: recombination regulator RecX [Eubacterium sp.]|nr:recombination regulator RecX [Eubacterium sp.]
MEEEEIKKATKKAMDLLLLKDRTVKELQDRLAKAGFSPEAVKGAIDYVDSYGYLDDERYARTYLDYHKGQRSRRELAYKLEQKGISRETVTLVLEDYQGQDEREAVTRLLTKRLKGRDPRELTYEDWQKHLAYLARKGYSLPVAKGIIEEMKA